MSALRARCPDCRTLTAVAIDADYQCHACGREFAAGIVRVAAPAMELPWPEAAAVDESTLEAQIERIAKELPARPLVLGDSADAHVGAIRELARRHGRLGLVWLDERSDPPPLRLLLAAGDVAPGDVARALPLDRRLPEHVYVALHDVLARAPELELLLAELPRPAGAGFTGLDPQGRDGARVGRLGAALGL